MRGAVLDVGGKRQNKRGSFVPPEKSASVWWYINLDGGSKPNILADITNLPIENNSIDVVLCTEVLEHLENPTACNMEIQRVLKKDGIVFYSVPFLYPIHADPYDFRRYSPDGLRLLLSSYRSFEVFPMGGYLGTLAMLMEIGMPGFSKNKISDKILRRIFTRFAHYLYQLDIKHTDDQPLPWTKFTSGYFARAVK
jgi:SAM-dependent methyltransferase